MDYASELLETQGLLPLKEFWKKLKNEDKKSAKSILSIPEIKNAIYLTDKLTEEGVRHPKLYMLKGIIKKELEKNPTSKIIVFANYRSTIEEIIQELTKIEKIRIVKLIGQKEGLKQKEQMEIIRKFEDNTYNVMVGTSIIEEGLDIKTGAELAIFYDIVPSEIRTIQRRGRVGRTRAGRIIFLITNDTREQGYRWSAYHKEKKMKKTLQDMKYQLSL